MLQICSLLQFETDGNIFFSQFVAELDTVEVENECEKVILELKICSNYWYITTEIIMLFELK